MSGKSISDTAKELQVSTSALRYYDKIRLVQPTREENGYRSYQEWDFLMIKYVLVLKYGGFSIEEIQSILSYIRNESTEDCLKETETLVAEKIAEFQQKRHYYDQMLNLFETMPSLTTITPEKEQELDHYIERLYQELHENGRFFS